MNLDYYRLLYPVLPPRGVAPDCRRGRGVGTRGYYGVLPSDRIVPYIHGVYNIVPL